MSCFYAPNVEYKKSARKDIKGREMTLLEEEASEIWTYRCQDDQVRVQIGVSVNVHCLPLNNVNLTTVFSPLQHCMTT